MIVSGTSGDAQVDRRFEMARDLAARGDHAAAADLLAQTRALVPGWAPLLFYLGEYRRCAGYREDARRAFDDYLRLDPADTLGAAVKKALLAPDPAPAAVSPHYVEALFDEYAPRFDRALVEGLGYRTPQVIADHLDGLHPAAANEKILDLGCGTGLAAAALAHRAQIIDGIDLSARMLDQARARGLYRRLTRGDILDALPDHDRDYDLIVAADVFVYCGALERLCAGTADHLKPNGLFAFSVQAHDGPEHFVIGPDHRYAHNRGYIEQCVQAAAFDVAILDRSILRRDGNKNVEGFVVVAARSV